MPKSTDDKIEQVYDAIILGAGMVGASLGCALNKLGMKVLLIDSSNKPEYKKSLPPQVRVSALNLASANILKNLNAWSHLENTRHCPFSTMEIWEEKSSSSSFIDSIPFASKVKNKINKTVFKCSDINQTALGFIVENEVLRYSLHQQLSSSENITIMNNTKAVDINLNGHLNEKQLILDNGETVSSHLIIGADGAQSHIREKSNIGVSRKEYRQSVLVIVAEINENSLNCTWQAFTKTGPMSLLPMPKCNNKNYASIVWYHNHDEITRLNKLSDEELLNEIAANFPEKLPRLIKLYERQCFPLARQSAHLYVSNGVVLVGDAAHTINPLAGQGLNLGLMDVAQLYDAISIPWKENQPYWSNHSLSHYQKECQKRNQKMACIMDAFYYGFSNNIFIFKLLRNVGLSFAGKLGPITKCIEYYGAGLSGKLPTLAKGFYKQNSSFYKFWQQG